MKLDVLLEKPSNKILLCFFIAALILFFVFINILFATIWTHYPTGYGFNEFKFAWTKVKMDEILGVWMAHPEDLISLMIYAHVIDFFFMGIYGTLLSTGTLLVARAIGEIKILQKIFLWCFFLGWIAVALDVIEGINIYIVLFNPTTVIEINTFSAALSTTICIQLIGVNLILILVGFVLVIVVYIKARIKKE